jgi:hypothetical protein
LKNSDSYGGTLAAVVDAALVLWGLKIFTSMPDLIKTVRVHLQIVSIVMDKSYS